MQPVEVELCAGTACHLMGAHELLTAVNTLKQTYGQRLQVRLTHCLGACERGPNTRINGLLYSRLTEEKLLALVNDLLATNRGTL